jgi:hypothetical protein
VPQGKIKAIITNINRSDQELEKKFPTKPKNQSHQNKIPIMYIISKDTKNAKIIKKCYLQGSVMAFIAGHACQTKMSRTMFLHCPSSSIVPFLPESSWTLYKFWKLYHIMVMIKYGISILRTRIVTVFGIKYDRSQNLRESE